MEMAKKLDDTKVKMGNLIPVDNTGRKFGEAHDYYAVKLEDYTGKKENWYLFTGAEISKMSKVDVLDSTEMKLGRMYLRHKHLKSARSYVKLNVPSNRKATGLITFVTLLSDNVLARGLDRAKRNPEDIPEMSWLEDLKD